MQATGVNGSDCLQVIDKVGQNFRFLTFENAISIVVFHQHEFKQADDNC